MSNIDNHLNNIVGRLWDRGRTPGSGRAAVMVGAGFSRNAQPLAPRIARPFPTWLQLARMFVDKLHPRCPDCHGDGTLGTEGECAKHKVRQHHLHNVTETSGATRLAHMFESVHGRAALEEVLANAIPESEYEPGLVHQKLVRLPWADIFTTNWDRLLENSVDLYDRSYSVVNIPMQIATSRAPRIVKLHGSFGAGMPLIFTEEDFIAYPHTHAPFVSLVQQSMMENVFVLIGFSGEDPNFLHWLSWVRRELRDYIQQVYLIDIVELSEPETRLLTKRGVIPLNISGFAGPRYGNDEYRSALCGFFDYLEKGRSLGRAAWGWPKRGARDALRMPWLSKENGVAIARDWHERVTNAPKWLAIPADSRDMIRSYLGERSALTNLLKGLSCDHNSKAKGSGLEIHIKAAATLLMLHEMGRTVPSPDEVGAVARLFLTMRGIVLKPSEDPLTALIRGTRTPAGHSRGPAASLAPSADAIGLILAALLRYARQTSNDELFNWAEHELNPAADRSVMSVYGVQTSCSLIFEQALCALGNSDPKRASDLLARLPTEQAGLEWNMRKAGLLTELNRNDEAREILKRVGDQLRRLRFEPNKHHEIIWLQSREGWAYYAYGALLHADHRELERRSRIDSNELPIGDGLEQLDERCSELAASRNDPRDALAVAEAELLEAAYETRLSAPGSTDGNNISEAAFSFLMLMEAAGLSPRMVRHTRVTPTTPMAVTAGAILWGSHPKLARAIMLRAAAANDLDRPPLSVRSGIDAMNGEEAAAFLAELEERASRLISQIDEPDISTRYCDDRLGTIMAMTRLVVATRQNLIGPAFRMACNWYSSHALARAPGTYDPLRQLFKTVMSSDGFDWPQNLLELYALPYPMRSGECWGDEWWPDPFEFLVRRARARFDAQGTEWTYSLSPDLGATVVAKFAAQLRAIDKDRIQILHNVKVALREHEQAPVMRRLFLFDEAWRHVVTPLRA